MTLPDRTSWQLDNSTGELLVHTTVVGRAAKMGHRLTIAVRSWQATVTWEGDQPASLDLTCDVPSLQVLRGEGGVTPLTARDKAAVQTNTMNSFDPKRFPVVSFRSSAIDPVAGGYRIAGALTIRDRTADHELTLAVEDRGESWRLSGRTEVLQTQFGITPYSTLMGAMKVGDAVVVSFAAEVEKG